MRPTVAGWEAGPAAASPLSTRKCRGVSHADPVLGSDMIGAGGFLFCPEWLGFLVGLGGRRNAETHGLNAGDGIGRGLRSIF